MVRLITHGATGMWLLTDSTATVTPKAPHLADSLNQLWLSSVPQQPKFIWQLRIYHRRPHKAKSPSCDTETHEESFFNCFAVVCLWKKQPSVLRLMTHHHLFLPFRRHQPRTGWALPKWRNKCCAAAPEIRSLPGSAAGLPIVILNFIAPPSVPEGTYTQRGLNLPKAAGKWVGSEWTLFAGWGIRTGILWNPVFVCLFSPRLIFKCCFSVCEWKHLEVGETVSLLTFNNDAKSCFVFFFWSLWLFFSLWLFWHHDYVIAALTFTAKCIYT